MNCSTAPTFAPTRLMVRSVRVRVLALTFRVSQINGQGCVAYPGAVVDVWHCDALGVYSDVTDRGVSTVGQQFLRGYQVTDANGIASFVTIYPGWYPGRTVHIHFKIRSEATSDSSLEFTSQLFFDDAFTDQVVPPGAVRRYRRTQHLQHRRRHLPGSPTAC